MLQNQSTSYRATIKRLRKFGYEGVLKHVDSSSCGSPSCGSYFATIYYQTSMGVDETKVLDLIGDPKLLPRGFQNCLLPVGVPQKLWDPKGWDYQEPRFPQRPNHLGTCHQHPVVDPSGPALLDPDLRVQLPNGLRRLDA
jgi:hypothetical protein